jgi:hypothetical protein
MLLPAWPLLAARPGWAPGRVTGKSFRVAGVGDAEPIVHA